MPHALVILMCDKSEPNQVTYGGLLMRLGAMRPYFIGAPRQHHFNIISRVSRVARAKQSGFAFIKTL